MGHQRLILVRYRFYLSCCTWLTAFNSFHFLANLHSALAYISLIDQLTITGGGSASPALVQIPGLYSASDPGILVNIHASMSTYVEPGPTVYSGGTTKSAGAGCTGVETGTATGASYTGGGGGATSTATKATTTSTLKTTTSVSAVVPTTSSSSACTAAKFAQCGGTGFTGCTTCAVCYSFHYIPLLLFRSRSYGRCEH